MIIVHRVVKEPRPPFKTGNRIRTASSGTGIVLTGGPKHLYFDRLFIKGK